MIHSLSQPVNQSIHGPEAVDSSSGAGCPDRFLRPIGREKFDQSGRGASRGPVSTAERAFRPAVGAPTSSEERR